MEFPVDTVNTVESQIILHDQEVLCQLREEAQRALERMKHRDLDEAEMVTVVTRYKSGRTFMCRKRLSVHTYRLAAWEVHWSRFILQRLVLCSDGNLYFRMVHQNFWHHWVEHMMPIELADRTIHRDALEAVKKLGVKGSGGITGWG